MRPDFPATSKIPFPGQTFPQGVAKVHILFHSLWIFGVWETVAGFGYQTITGMGIINKQAHTILCNNDKFV